LAHGVVEDDTFRVLVEESFTLLESLVYSAMRWVGEDLASSAAESPDHLLEHYCRRSSHDRSDQPPESSTTDGDGTTTGADRGHSAPLQFNTSPFDLFYYKNTEASRHVVNCHQHVGTAAIHFPETLALLHSTQLKLSSWQTQGS
jgi:hypothetical protein